ncbi:uncharacterized protein B0H64DRAFT_325599 [Chaetomium fimeti]|uniref:Glycosyltransferase family 25 protein n=1 Tax=Chaetomium fimeti TaxID=1854472 RepID=A0AAE0HD15_9PEZI|nr:hypothetical protein B0H64DRAFT_325599 [Chaetomium fimeti]
MQVEFVDGVMGKDVPDKAIPMAKGKERMRDASIGSWRAHMNAVREIVQRNLSSALIMEDDIDWDVRIKDQLYDFALVSQTLTQPLRGRTGAYADPTYPKPSKDSPETPPELDFHHLPATTPATTSPYGDDWDLLWVGHCGMHFPFKNGKNVPRSRVIRPDDETVAPKKNLWTFNIPFTLADKYPPHTRAYHHVQEGVCTLAYAVSRRGAQKLLREVGLREVTDAYDILLRFFCEGTKGRKAGRQCLTTQPTLFAHHRPAGPASAMSDIGNHKGWRDRPMTDIIRWSVRMNADVLMDGGADVADQWPDEAK